ncbi:Diacylglycerol kinase [Rhizina undulata]
MAYPSPTPISSATSSSTSLPAKYLDTPDYSGSEEEYMSESSQSSHPSEFEGSRSELRQRAGKNSKEEREVTRNLAPPLTKWRPTSRSPSPLGLIPVHEQFSSFIHKHEVPRKLLHVSIGFLCIHLYKTGVQPANLTPGLVAAFIPIASADILRFYSPKFNRLYIKTLGFLMRESEVGSWNGVVSYILGTCTVLYFFPKDVASLSILLLSWCDTAASTFGRAWGRYTPRIRKNKSLAGSLASFVVGALTAAAFWGWIVPSAGSFPDDPVGAVMWSGRLGIEGVGEVKGGWALAVMSVVTGLVASVSEAMDVCGLDDNVVIPVLSAVGVWGVLKLFG